MKFFNGFNFTPSWLASCKIISIDFGHGDISAALRTTHSIEDLCVGDNNTKVIPSRIGYDENGNAYIGSKANTKKEVYPYFKGRPDLFNEYMDDSDKTRLKLVEDCFRLLINDIYKYNDLRVKKSDKLLLLVGCPSDTGWDRLKNEYAAVIRKATGIKNVAIIPESKAAIINALENNNGIDINQGVIVFDFGSLTSDCTYIMPKSKAIEDLSMPLGASMVEKNMLKYALGALPESVLKNKNRELNMLRNQKEDFYSGNFESNTYVLSKKDSASSPSYIEICPSTMNKIIKGVDEKGKPLPQMVFRVNNTNDTWYNHCKRFFADAKTRLVKSGGSVKTIIITGGARRMSFIEELCRETFNDNSIRIIPESNPSFSVSRGLCFTGYKDAQAVAVLDDVTNSITTKVRDKVKDLSNDVAEALSEKIYDIAKKEINTWSTGTDKSINDLSAPLHNTLTAQITPEMMGSISQPIVSKWLNSIRGIVEAEVNGSFKKIYKNSVSVETYRITDARWRKIIDILTNTNVVGADKMNFSEILENIDLTGKIGAVVRGIVLVMLFLVIIGPIYFFGKIWDWLTDGDKDETFDSIIEKLDDIPLLNNRFLNGQTDPSTPLSSDKRSKVYNQFSSDAAKFKDVIKNKILTKITSELNKQYDSKDGFGIGQAVQASLEDAISTIALQNIRPS